MIFDNGQNEDNNFNLVRNSVEHKNIREWIEGHYLSNRGWLEAQYVDTLRENFSAGFPELYFISTLAKRLKLELQRPENPDSLDAWIPTQNIRLEVVAPERGVAGSPDSVPATPKVQGSMRWANEKTINALTAAGHDTSDIIPTN